MIFLESVFVSPYLEYIADSLYCEPFLWNQKWYWPILELDVDESLIYYYFSSHEVETLPKHKILPEGRIYDLQSIIITGLLFIEVRQ